MKHLTGKTGFEKADELWTSIQENLLNFINSHNGMASFYANKNIIARPYWTDVKEYLKGSITFDQLKQNIGC